MADLESASDHGSIAVELFTDSTSKRNPAIRVLLLHDALRAALKADGFLWFTDQEGNRVPLLVAIYYNIAIINARMGNLGKAYMACREVLNRDPNHPRARSMMDTISAKYESQNKSFKTGLVALRNGDSKAAAISFEKALSIPGALVSLASLATDPAEAKDLLTMALDARATYPSHIELVSYFVAKDKDVSLDSLAWANVEELYESVNKC